jgi:hypothetical protein
MKAEEAEARAINAQPWEPPPGMVKRQCPECRYFFALLPSPARTERHCPAQIAPLRVPGRRNNPRELVIERNARRRRQRGTVAVPLNRGRALKPPMGQFWKPIDSRLGGYGSSGQTGCPMNAASGMPRVASATTDGSRA